MRSINLLNFLLFSLIVVIIFSGCSTAPYTTFQDGNPIGKGNKDIIIGLTLGPSHEIEKLEDLNGQSEIKYRIDSRISSLLSIDGRAGISDQIDFGVSVGLSGYVHAKLYGKLCLFKSESPLGVAIIPAVGFGGTMEGDPEGTNSQNSNEEQEDIGYFLTQLSIPVSISISNRLILTANPFIQQQKYKAEYTWLENTTFKDTFTATSRGVVIGMKFTPFPAKTDGYILPELAMVSNSLDDRVLPYLGICIGGTQWYRN